MNYPDYQHILFDRPQPNVLLMTLNRPEVLNATNVQMHTELVNIWQTIERDPSVHVVVVTGAGRAFSAGGDLKLVEDAYKNPEEIIRVLDEARDLVYNMLRFSKPVISAINGVAVGAGLVVALLADISIAAENAKLGDGHVRLGVAAGDHAAIVWPLLVSMAKAKYYLMTGELIDGREAERIGLVSMCLPDDQVRAKALDVAARLASGARHAIRFTKRSLNQWMLQAGPIFDHSCALEMIGFFHEDLAAGVDGLRNRRAASYPSSRL